MPQWEPFHGWMAFKYLDVNAGLAGSFTIGYRFTDDGADNWTARFNRFKAKKRVAIRGGVKLARCGSYCTAPPWSSRIPRVGKSF